MRLNEGPLWVLLALACATGVVATFRNETRRTGAGWRYRWTDERRSFVTRSVDALITGIGFGMVAVFVIVLLAAVMVRLGV